MMEITSPQVEEELQDQITPVDDQLKVSKTVKGSKAKAASINRKSQSTNPKQQPKEQIFVITSNLMPIMPQVQLAESKVSVKKGGANNKDNN